MKIANNYNKRAYNNSQITQSRIKYNTGINSNNLSEKLFANSKTDISFSGNPFKTVTDLFKYIRVQRFANGLNVYLKSQPNHEQLAFRNLSMEMLEGIQYGIKAFKGLTMKDIQYLSENLHVIAVKRGCNNMCGYCYADAKPSKREMSWEDFTTITRGFKELRKRLGDLPIFGENLPTKRDPIYTTTELFYDSDCMNIAIKDKKGKIYDMRDLINEVYESLGRKSCFDTSGWNPDNKIMQERAEKYAEYFSKPENINKLNAFNLSFNPFNASYVAAIKALKAGDVEKYQRLRNKFTDRIANAVFTFTPLLKYDNFGIMVRSFGLKAENAKYFDFPAMLDLIKEITKKLEKLYKADLNGAKKHIKTSENIKEYINIASAKMNEVSTGLNSSGRMKQFLETFEIKDSSLQNHTETTKAMYNELIQDGRYHIYLAHRLIDTDGKVYHMDYARFFPTEIQLNIKDKTPTPKLANLREDCLITKEVINRKEEYRPVSDFI